MSIRVKICGLARHNDVVATAALEPDFLGFIFYPPSKRAVSAVDVAAWTVQIPAHIQKVGVFVNATAEEINETCEVAGLDIAQLHGQEHPELIAQLSVPSWKVVHVDKMTAAEAQAFSVETLLIDSYTEALPGGTGTTVDWSAAANFVRNAQQNVLLAGGLTPDNVARAVETVSPWGVDVSSGVERAPGEKDMKQVKQFIHASRNV